MLTDIQIARAAELRPITEEGLANLVRHIENVRKFRLEPVVGVNRLAPALPRRDAAAREDRDGGPMTMPGLPVMSASGGRRVGEDATIVGLA